MKSYDSASQVGVNLFTKMIIYLLWTKSAGWSKSTADLTLVNEQAIVRKGRISYLKCVSDIDLGYTPFKRVVDTGSGTRLPESHLIGPISPEEWPGKRLSLFIQGDRERNGIFSCEMRDPDTSVLTKAIAIKIGSDGGIWSDKFTYTANVGDRNFDIVFKAHKTNMDVVWRFNGNVVYEQKSLVRRIAQVSSADAGFYECYKRSSQNSWEHRPLNQAIMRVIVRGCPAGKWNVQDDCNRDCWCINGGQCDHFTGECVCPPGFKGPNCEQGCGGNRFGASCQFRCKAGGSNQGKDAEECKGRHFCLPDPYGCSCSSGFKGVDCTEGCVRGVFGADCKVECHCKRPDLCDRFTGSCTMGCAAGWTGPSCQTRCERGKWGENCENDCHCYNGARCDAEDGTCPDDRCEHPYSGKSCQVDALDECQSSPCMHGGTCVDKILEYECVCLNGTGGVHCQNDFDDCESSPCHNGATCQDDGRLKYLCSCVEGFTGSDCDIDIDDCEGHKCANEASCKDAVNGYECSCKAGYDGEFCEHACAPGEFYNDETSSCELCPKDSYQELSLKSFCSPCPEGMITINNGTSSNLECIASSIWEFLLANPKWLAIGGSGAVVVIGGVSLGLWYYVTHHKNNTRLQHLGTGRSAW